jgi:hypothetical protein
MTRGAGTVLGATGAISVVTAIDRLDVLPVRLFTSSPQSFEDGRFWLLGTSVLVADRPAVASILGFAVVGLAAVALCGTRVSLLAGVSGHLLSAALVYSLILAARLDDPTAFHSVFSEADFGTSAVIAAWLGAVAYRLWARRRQTLAVALVVVSGLIGWLCKGNLTALDVEHAVALACGILAARGVGALSLLPAGRNPFRRVLRAPDLSL